MRAPLLAAAAALGVLFPAARAAAQLSQYTEPGSLAISQVPARDQIRERAREARWSLGKLKIDPRVSLGNLGYVENVFDSAASEEPVSDFRGSAGLGLDAYFNLGPKVLANGFVFGNYSWWQEQDQLRVFSGSVGARVFGFFNRLGLQVEGGRVERERNLSSELEVPVQIRHDRAAFSVEVDVRGPFAFFASAAGQRTRHSDEVELRLDRLDVSALDRDGWVFDLGVSYELRNGLTLGVGVERTDTDFVDDLDSRTNTSFGPLLRWGYAGSRLDVSGTAVQRMFDFDDRPSDDDVEELTGSLQVTWKFSERTGVTLYAGQQLVYSALDTDGVFSGERFGVAARRMLTRRGQLRLYLESGRDEPLETIGRASGRVDDLESYGGTFTLELDRGVTLNVGLRHTDRDSNLPEFDRSLDSIIAGVDLGESLLPW